MCGFGPSSFRRGIDTILPAIVIDFFGRDSSLLVRFTDGWLRSPFKQILSPASICLHLDISNVTISDPSTERFMRLSQGFGNQVVCNSYLSRPLCVCHISSISSTPVMCSDIGQNARSRRNLDCCLAELLVPSSFIPIQERISWLKHRRENRMIREVPLDRSVNAKRCLE